MPRVYAGKTAEDRTGERRRQLIDAAVSVIGTKGIANTTVRGVCEAAGLSSRSFYESFESLDALAVAAYDECVQSGFTTIYGATVATTGSAESQSHAAVGAIVDYLAANPERSRLVLLESLGSGPLADKRRETMQLLTSVVASLGRAAYGGADEHDPVLTLTATLVAGGIAELMIAWLNGAIELPSEEFVDHCARLILAIGETAVRRA